MEKGFPAEPPPPYSAPVQQPVTYPPAPQTGYPPAAQAGYQPVPQTGYSPGPQQGYVVAPTTQTQPVTTTTVVVAGGTGNCPSCRVGNLTDNFTVCGILCAVCFFPLGVICCLLMTEKQCTHCGSTF